MLAADSSVTQSPSLRFQPVSERVYMKSCSLMLTWSSSCPRNTWSLTASTLKHFCSISACKIWRSQKQQSFHSCLHPFNLCAWAATCCCCVLLLGFKSCCSVENICINNKVVSMMRALLSSYIHANKANLNWIEWGSLNEDYMQTSKMMHLWHQSSTLIGSVSLHPPLSEQSHLYLGKCRCSQWTAKLLFMSVCASSLTGKGNWKHLALFCKLAKIYNKSHNLLHICIVCISKDKLNNFLWLNFLNYSNHVLYIYLNHCTVTRIVFHANICIFIL